MRFITTIRQGWKRVVRVSLTIGLLSAVAAVGLTLLGSKVFATWKAPVNAERALASGSAFDGLLNFEAPEATVARRETQKEEFERDIKKANDALLAKRWKFTAETVNFSQQLIEFMTLNPGQSLNLQALIGQAQQFELGLQLLVILCDLLPPGHETSFLGGVIGTLEHFLDAWLSTFNNLVNSLGLNFLAQPLLPPSQFCATPFF